MRIGVVGLWHLGTVTAAAALQVVRLRFDFEGTKVLTQS
jgi:hypothetical protein